MRLARHWQTLLFLAAVILAACVNLAFQPTLLVQTLILAPAVIVLGLPHGAFDLPIAQARYGLQGVGPLGIFLSIYMAIAAAVLGLWLLFPGAALLTFLAYSAVHFSGDWSDDPRVWRIAGGAGTLGAPALARPDEVAAIFDLLAPAPFAVAGTYALIGTGLLSLLACAAAAITQFRPRAFIEIAGLWLAAIALPPLVYFVVYFCFLHSPRHLTDAVAETGATRSALSIAAALTGMTVLIALAFLPFLMGLDVETTLIRLVFIGLAALTVPHMILIDLDARPAVPEPDPVD